MENPTSKNVSSNVEVKCGYCGNKFEVDKTWLGLTLTCPECNAEGRWKPHLDDVPREIKELARSCVRKRGTIVIIFSLIVTIAIGIGSIILFYVPADIGKSLQVVFVLMLLAWLPVDRGFSFAFLREDSLTDALRETFHKVHSYGTIATMPSENEVRRIAAKVDEGDITLAEIVVFGVLFGIVGWAVGGFWSCVFGVLFGAGVGGSVAEWKRTMSALDGDL